MHTFTTQNDECLVWLEHRFLWSPLPFWKRLLPTFSHKETTRLSDWHSVCLAFLLLIVSLRNMTVPHHYLPTITNWTTDFLTVTICRNNDLKPPSKRFVIPLFLPRGCCLVLLLSPGQLGMCHRNQPSILLVPR